MSSVESFGSLELVHDIPVTGPVIELICEGLGCAYDPSAPIDDWLPALMNDNQVYYGVKACDRLVAVAGIVPPGERWPEAYLDVIAVAHSNQRQGIGSFLLEVMENVAAEEYSSRVLRLRPSSDDATTFYEQRGYIPYDGGNNVDLIKYL